MIKKIFTAVMMLTASLTTFAQTQYDRDLEGRTTDIKRWNLNIRGGYSIGGTLPMGFPAEMRSLNSYAPKINYRFGVDVERRFNEDFGLQGGIYFERRGFKGDIGIRQYGVILQQGGEEIHGPYTGNVVVNIIQTGFTFPLQATWWPSSSVKLKFGPYVSLITDRSFYGYAYNGYLRRGEVRGDLVNVGNDGNTRGYFSGELFDKGMRKFQWGLNLGCDYYFAQHWGMFGDLSYGLNSAFKSDFETVTMGLYPLYFTLGITYKFGR